MLDRTTLLAFGLAAGVVLVVGLHLLGGLPLVLAVTVPAALRFALPAGVIMRLAGPLLRTRPATSTESVELVQRLAGRGRLRPPHLYVRSSDAIDAHVMPGTDGGAIVVSQALLERPESEQAAVLAHELAHLHCRHGALAAVAGLALIAVTLASLAVSMGVADVSSRVPAALSSPTALSSFTFALLAATFLGHTHVRRRMEWQADDLAVALTGDRLSMLSVLRARERELTDRVARRQIAARIARLAERAPAGR